MTGHLRVRAIGLPPGMDVIRNPVVQAIEEATGRRVALGRRDEVPDLYLASSFGRGISRVASRAVGWVGRRLQSRGYKLDRPPVVPTAPGQVPVLWWTGENIRPPVGATVSLSFDTDSWGNRNLYWPLWHLLLNDEWSYPLRNFLGLPMTQKEMLRDRHVHQPQHFAAAIIGNETSERRHAIELLSEIGRVDIFGNGDSAPLKSKAEISGRYKFILAFENDLYPGYVTEKAIEAWHLGSVPIYWGLDPKRYLNESAMVPWNPGGAESALARVEHLMTSPLAWQATADQPILERPFDKAGLLDHIYQRLAELNLV